MTGKITSLLILLNVLFVPSVVADWSIDPNQCNGPGMHGAILGEDGLFNRKYRPLARFRAQSLDIWCASTVLDDYGSRLDVQIEYADNSPEHPITCQAWEKDSTGAVIEASPQSTSGNGNGTMTLVAPARGSSAPPPQTVVVNCIIPDTGLRTQGDNGTYPPSGIKSIRIY